MARSHWKPWCNLNTTRKRRNHEWGIQRGSTARHTHIYTPARWVTRRTLSLTESEFAWQLVTPVGDARRLYATTRPIQTAFRNNLPGGNRWYILDVTHILMDKISNQVLLCHRNTSLSKKLLLQGKVKYIKLKYIKNNWPLFVTLFFFQYEQAL